jgi:hypothetical protein
MNVLLWNAAIDLWPCEQHYSNLDKTRLLLKVMNDESGGTMTSTPKALGANT